ncbi:hypothetical protein ACOME3_009769 [Neoechinorhynchus agilis]
MTMRTPKKRRTLYPRQTIQKNLSSVKLQPIPMNLSEGFFNYPMSTQQMQELAVKPLNKSELRHMINIVNNILNNLGYPENVSPQILSKPLGSRMYFGVCQFFISKIDSRILTALFGSGKAPNDQMKMNADVLVKVMTILGYQLKINKSYLTSVSATHSWPSLLYALYWLAELAHIYSTVPFQSAAILLLKAELHDDIPEERAMSQSDLQNLLERKIDATTDGKCVRLFFNLNEPRLF